MLGFVTLQCAQLCSPALWLPPYDLGLGGDFRTSEAAVSEGELISKIRARLTTRLSLLFTRGCLLAAALAALKAAVGLIAHTTYSGALSWTGARFFRISVQRQASTGL